MTARDLRVRLLFLILLTIVILLVAACGQDQQEEYDDAPRGARDDAPADLINMPDGFPNVATKCVDGVRYTVTRRAESSGAGIAVGPCTYPEVRQ